MGNNLSELRNIFWTDSRIQNFFTSQQLQIHADNCYGIIYNCPDTFSTQTRLCFCIKKENIQNREFNRSRAFWPVPVIEHLFLPEFKSQKFCKNCDFEVISFIANGAFGKVFKVLDQKSNKLYAMKILQKARIIEENAVVQVKDEMRIQSICGHHQFLVNCLFSWQTHSEIFFVSEYKSGGELLGLIEKFAPLPENIVRIFVAEIAMAIDFLHNAGIIHRDIKPENILLDENYHLSLTDFGLSKWLSIGSRTSTICGTPQYMAPEIKAMESYTHAVDWWSLGIVTCRLLTNEYPEIQDSKTNLPKVNDLSAPSQDLLLRLLTVDPLRRLRHMYALRTIAFFKDFNFKNISDRQVNPKELLFSHYRIKEFRSSVFDDFDANSYSKTYGTLV